MSQEQNSGKRVIKISENKLVDVMDQIVQEAISKKNDAIINEAVEKRMAQWISEQETKKESLLESKVNELEKIVKKLTEGKE